METVIKNFIETSFNLVIYMFQNAFNNPVTSSWLYIFAILVTIVMFKKLVGIE